MQLVKKTTKGITISMCEYPNFITVVWYNPDKRPSSGTKTFPINDELKARKFYLESRERLLNM